MGPYAQPPPWVPVPQTARARRSPTATTFGILSIVFGAVGGLYELGHVAAQAVDMFVPMTPSFAAASTELQAAGPGIAVNAVIFCAMSAVLVVAGIGLLRQREWGRRTAVVWCIAALCVVPLRAAIWELAIRPHTERAAAATAAAMAKELSSAIPALSGFGGFSGGSPAWYGQQARSREYPRLLLLAAYPVVMMVMLMQRGVRDSLAARRSTES
jgi:hypothetical protein